MRRLTLKRDILLELTSDELAGVAGGTTKTTTVVVDTETAYSCMTYISCHIVQCLPSVPECVEATVTCR